MLVATPLAIMPEHRKPRVISEIKKVTPKTPLDHIQPRISGELLYCNPAYGQWLWCKRLVQVRGGTLLVQQQTDAFGVVQQPPLRLALRHLHLRPAGDAPRTFALVSQGCPDEQPIAIFQASTPREYEIWIKTIAIELMRQTPLEAIKYLDIIGLVVDSPNNSATVRATPATVIRSRRSSSSDRSDSTTTSPTISKRRCRSELRLNIEDTRKVRRERVYSSSDEESNENRTKDSHKSELECKRTARRSLFQENRSRITNDKKVVEACLECPAQDTVDGISKTLDVNRNIAFMEDPLKVQARERIRKVISLKQKENMLKGRTENCSKLNTTSQIINEGNCESEFKKTDFSNCCYTRVYNVREGIQLKSYDLKQFCYPKDKKQETANLTDTNKPKEVTSKINICKYFSKKCVSKNNEPKQENNIGDFLKDHDKETVSKNCINITKNNEDKCQKEYFSLTDYKSRYSKNDNYDVSKTRDILTRNSSSDRFLDVQSDEEAVEVLLQRCQNADSYVPVKDKLMLFESLCRLGRRLARSSEDLVSLPSNGSSHKRARSMHDLTRCGIGVRQICKYFETRSEPEKIGPDQKQNKYNTIAKGYRKISHSKERTNLDRKFITDKCDYTNAFSKNNYFFGFKQFREGNKIISYV